MDQWNFKELNKMNQQLNAEWPCRESELGLPGQYSNLGFSKPFENRTSQLSMHLSNGNSFSEKQNTPSFPIYDNMNQLYREPHFPPAWQQRNWLSPPGFESTPPTFSPLNLLKPPVGTLSMSRSLGKSFSSLAMTDSATQTESNNAQQEKLGLCETILSGCDAMKKMFNTGPSYNLKEYTEALKENVLESLTPSLCCSLASGATEQTIISEYAKSFIRISESWLGTRNCFGSSDRCGRLCRLETQDLSVVYTEWMNASRKLLDVMLHGLQNVNMMYTTDPSIHEDETEAESLYGDFREPKLTPNTRERPFRKNQGSDNLKQQKMPGKSLRKYAGQSCPLLPIPPQAYVSVPPLSSEYMKPSSYNVPRKELSQTKKSANISQAKSNLWETHAKSATGSYVVGLPVVPIQKREGECNDETEVSQKVYQIAIRKKDVTKKSSKNNDFSDYLYGQKTSSSSSSSSQSDRSTDRSLAKSQ